MRNLRREIGLLVTPENIAAWERALPMMSQADREQLEGLLAEMKERGRAIRDRTPRSLARTA